MSVIVLFDSSWSSGSNSSEERREAKHHMPSPPPPTKIDTFFSRWRIFVHGIGICRRYYGRPITFRTLKRKHCNSLRLEPNSFDHRASRLEEWRRWRPPEQALGKDRLVTIVISEYLQLFWRFSSAAHAVVVNERSSGWNSVRRPLSLFLRSAWNWTITGFTLGRTDAVGMKIFLENGDLF